MVKKKGRAVAEERVEERAPEPVAEPPRSPMPEINPVPYLGVPPEEEVPPESPAVVVPPVPVIEKAPPLEEQFRSLNSQRLVSIARSHGVSTEGRGREELVAGIVAAVKAQETVVSTAPAAEEAPEAEASPKAVVPPSHSFLLGPGEKPLATSGAPPLAPEKPKAEVQPVAESERPAARKPHSSL